MYIQAMFIDLKVASTYVTNYSSAVYRKTLESASSLRHSALKFMSIRAEHYWKCYIHPSSPFRNAAQFVLGIMNVTRGNSLNSDKQEYISSVGMHKKKSSYYKNNF